MLRALHLLGTSRQGNQAIGQRAILRLYRSATEQSLAQAGAGLGTLTMPALVIWGLQDPYIGPEFGQRYADALPNATFERIENAGHWPWLDDPGVIDTVTRFLEAA